jgi:ATP-dependent Clp protease ATP-binding subunit ClpB
VILFDEIEKAHPDVFHVLLQILDDGRVTDAQGHTVDFKNTVIIMTSNIGSPILLESMTSTGRITESAREQVMAQLRQHFRPEFLNRIDDVVLFSPLRFDEIKRIIDLLTQDLVKRLEDHKITIELTEPAKELIAREGFDPVYGARPLKRFLQRQLETRIGRAIIAGEVLPGSTVTVDVQGGQLHLEIEKAAPVESAA